MSLCYHLSMIPYFLVVFNLNISFNIFFNLNSLVTKNLPKKTKYIFKIFFIYLLIHLSKHYLKLFYLFKASCFLINIVHLSMYLALAKNEIHN